MSKENRRRQKERSLPIVNPRPTRAPNDGGNAPAPTRGQLAESLYDMQTRLIADIEGDRKLPSPGEIGQSIESRIREALSSVPPEKVGISHGFVVDSYGSTSKQMDIILYDRFNCPRIRAAAGPDGAEVFPVEATYACGEVKTRLHASQLRDCFDKCESYKSLSRVAYRDPHPYHPIATAKPFGEALGAGRYWESIFFVIAFDATDFLSLRLSYEHLVRQHGLGHRDRIDLAVALNHSAGKKNILVSANETKDSKMPEHSLVRIELTPEPQGHIVDFESSEPWSIFVGLLLNDMVQVTAQPLDAGRYNWYALRESL